MDNKIHIAIRSYKRAGDVKTITVVPSAYIYVPESQFKGYSEAYGDRVIAVPDDEDGNPSRKNNAILNRTPCEWTLILDDDISRIGYFEGGEHFWASAEQLEVMIAHCFGIASQLGVHMWGIGQMNDPLAYDTYRPFSLLSPILGPFVGHLSPELRYDESVLAKDDYDFWLQNIAAYHKTFRVNKYHYVHDHGIGAGGLTAIRTQQYELRGIERMRRKWGPCFVGSSMKGGKSATGTNILNTKVRIPIKGC